MLQTPSVSPLMNMVPLLFIFVIFYFLLIRPQKKQEKERQGMLKNLNKNDEIVTSGGIHGTIVNVKDKTVILRIDDNTKIEVEKNCVGHIKNTKIANQGS